MLSVESKLRAKVFHSHLHEFVSNEYKFMNREASSGTAINLKTAEEISQEVILIN
jgi:hypothetical protein